MVRLRTIIKTYKTSVIVVALVFLSVFPFWQNINDPFVSDDWNFLYVVSQNDVSLSRLLLTNTQGEFGPGTYRPTVNAFWYLMYQSAGLNPAPYHIATLVFHLANVLLVFTLVRYLISQVDTKHATTIAGLAGVFFALFPNHSAAVAWVSVINDTMMTTFYLLSLFLLLYGIRHGNAQQKRIYMASSLICATLALFTKEMAVSLPGVMALCLGIIWFYKDRTKHTAIRYVYALIPVILLVGVYMLLRLQVTGFLAEDYAHSSIGFSFTTLFNIGVGTFVGHIVSDWGRAAFVSLLLDYRMAIPGTIVGIGIASLLAKDLQEKKISVGWVALIGYVGALVPVVHFGIGYSHVYMSEEGERFAYLPSVFISLMLALLFHYTYQKAREYRFRHQVLVVILFLGVTGFMGMQLVQKNTRWSEAARLAEGLVDAAAVDMKSEGYIGAMFVGVPDNLHGAFIYRNGFDLALDVKHGITKDRVLVSANRTLHDPEGAYAVLAERRDRFIYQAAPPSYIADIPERTSLDYISSLSENIFDPASRSHGSLGSRLEIELTDAFIKTNRQREIGLFFFTGEGWHVFTL